jgi:hypothetical protein
MRSAFVLAYAAPPTSSALAWPVCIRVLSLARALAFMIIHSHPLNLPDPRTALHLRKWRATKLHRPSTPSAQLRWGRGVAGAGQRRQRQWRRLEQRWQRWRQCHRSFLFLVECEALSRLQTSSGEARWHIGGMPPTYCGMPLYCCRSPSFLRIDTTGSVVNLHVVPAIRLVPATRLVSAATPICPSIHALRVAYPMVVHVRQAAAPFLAACAPVLCATRSWCSLTVGRGANQQVRRPRQGRQPCQAVQHLFASPAECLVPTLHSHWVRPASSCMFCFMLGYSGVKPLQLSH